MKKESTESIIITQLLPISLTVVIFIFLTAVTYAAIYILNRFIGTGGEDILTKVQLSDVLVGMTIYLKTSVDFGILIGNLMTRYNHWRDRIAIEIGTALGNGLGTIIILSIWDYFRTVKWLLVAMIVLASLVLFKLAEEGLGHVRERTISQGLENLVKPFEKFITSVNKYLSPVLNKIVPHISMRPKPNLTFWGLFSIAFTIPFILGLDDFAGYVPLFSIVNVFGFAVGVYLGHMILNMALFISPKKTVEVVKNPYISFAGSVAFVGIALWGLFEAFKLAVLH